MILLCAVLSLILGDPTVGELGLVGNRCFKVVIMNENRPVLVEDFLHASVLVMKLSNESDFVNCLSFCPIFIWCV